MSSSINKTLQYPSLSISESISVLLIRVKQLQMNFSLSVLQIIFDLEKANLRQVESKHFTPCTCPITPKHAGSFKIFCQLSLTYVLQDAVFVNHQNKNFCLQKKLILKNTFDFYLKQNHVQTFFHIVMSQTIDITLAKKHKKPSILENLCLAASAQLQMLCC